MQKEGDAVSQDQRTIRRKNWVAALQTFALPIKFKIKTKEATCSPGEVFASFCVGVCDRQEPVIVGLGGLAEKYYSSYLSLRPICLITYRSAVALTFDINVKLRTDSPKLL